MESVTSNDHAFTGLEAAIVLIAFVVVAAVFSYVVLGAGFFTTQKSQETVYKGVEQATANIQMVGQVYGMAPGDASSGVNSVNFTIGLAPGAPSVDLDKLTLVFSTTTLTPITYTHATSSAPGAAGTTTFNTVSKDGAYVRSMSAQDQVMVNFSFSDGTNTAFVTKNNIIRIELRPSVGASLPFERTVPPTVKNVQVMY